ncbi:hypothetical protein C8R48DRAFT_779739 [Suillus tomentosus]|nr:hypothetical protein C8R48DRAFT_779739 [Suillus tomentosus]
MLEFSLLPPRCRVLSGPVDWIIIKDPNSASQFAQESPELAKFHEAIAQNDSTVWQISEDISKVSASLAPAPTLSLSGASRVRGNHLINVFSEVSANLNNRLRRRSIQAGDSLLVEHWFSTNGNELGRGSPGIQGWAVRMLPDLTRFLGITGGSAASSITHALGPSIFTQSPGYASSEGGVTITYNKDFIPDDVLTLLFSHMDLFQIVTCLPLNRRFCTLGRDVIAIRFNNALRWVVGPDFDGLRVLLDLTASVLLATAPIDRFVFARGYVDVATDPELRIATPADKMHIISSFLDMIGFIAHDQYRTPTTPDILVDNFPASFWRRRNKTVSIVESHTDSVLPVVLAHRTTADCMFVTTGGMFLGFPSAFEDLTCFSPEERYNAIHVNQFVTRGFHLEYTNLLWTSPCGQACPMLWHRRDDARMVVWGGGTLPTDIFPPSSFMWRLAATCHNPVCSSRFLMHAGQDLQMSPCCPSLVSVIVKWLTRYYVSIFAYNVSFHLLPCVFARNDQHAQQPIMALLYMPGASRSVLVPLYSDRMRGPSHYIDNVNIQMYVHEAGHDIPHVIDPTQTRTSCHMKGYEYIIIRNHEDLLNHTPHQHHPGPIRRQGGEPYEPLSPLSGSLLVIKRSSVLDRRLIDMTCDDKSPVVSLLIEVDELLECGLFDGMIHADSDALIE